MTGNSTLSACATCGKERIEWSFEGYGGQFFCRPCAKFTMTIPMSAYELYAGMVKKVEREDIKVSLAVWYPAEKKGRELVFYGCTGVYEVDPEGFGWNWSEGSLLAIAGRPYPDGAFHPYYVKDLLSGKDGFLEQIDVRDYIPGLRFLLQSDTETVYCAHPIGVHAKGEIKNVSLEIEEAIGPIKPSKTLVESVRAGETPKELRRVRGSELDEQLVEAARKGDYVWVRLLIAKGADVNAKVSTLATYMGSLIAFETPLMAAVSGNVNMEVIRYLVEKGADPAMEREIQRDKGISDVKLEGTGKYESAIDLALDTEVKEYLKAIAESRPRPRIKLDRSFSADKVIEGEEFEVKIVAENIGNDVARDVVIRDEIPDRSYYERPDMANHYEITRGTPEWKGSIPPGGKIEINYSIRLFEKIFDWKWRATCFYSGSEGEYFRQSAGAYIWFRTRVESRELEVLIRAEGGDEEAQKEFIERLRASSGKDRADYMRLVFHIHHKWLLKGLEPLLEDKNSIGSIRICDDAVYQIARISNATFSFPVNERTNYSDAQLAEVHAFLRSLEQ